MTLSANLSHKISLAGSSVSCILFSTYPEQQIPETQAGSLTKTSTNSAQLVISFTSLALVLYRLGEALAAFPLANARLVLMSWLHYLRLEIGSVPHLRR